MNIIDMHTHTFPAKIAAKALDKLSKMSGTVYFTGGTEEDLVSSGRKAGIQYSVILPVATSADQVAKINDGVIALAKNRKQNGILSFGAMHPGFEHPYEEIRRLADNGVRGIKLHPAYDGVDFDDPSFLPILNACAEHGLAVTVHAGIDIGIPQKDYCSTEMILRVLSKVPEVKLILAHMGGWHCWDLVKSELTGAPLLFDTSFSVGTITPLPDRNTEETPYLLSEEAFVSLCRSLGTDKILFGTDSPWTDQKREVEQIIQLPFTDAEKEAILYTNAKNLLFP